MNPVFFKIAAQLTPSSAHQEKLDTHFTSTDPKRWRDFRRNLRSKTFVDAVIQDERADKKLKQFAKMMNLHQTGKGPTFAVKSDSNEAYYTVKYHPDQDRFTCNCGDYTYKKSVKARSRSECKHIAELKSQMGMVKKAASAMAIARLGAIELKKDRAEKKALEGHIRNKMYERVLKGTGVTETLKGYFGL